MQKKTYLVTGACGLTGSHIVDVLVEQKQKVLATDLPQASRKNLRRRVPFIGVDLTVKRAVAKLFQEKIDVVLHPAGLFNFSAPYKKLRKVNVDGTHNLCETALKANVKRLVSWSTCGVYGKISMNGQSITEDYPQKPVEEYSRSKKEQDEVVFSYSKKGLPISIVRPGVVYGPRGKYGMGTVILQLSKLPILVLPYNFTFKMSPVHVRDVARAGIFLASKKEAVGEVYHVTDNSGSTMRDVILALSKVARKPVLPVVVPYALVSPLARIAAEVDTYVSLNILKKQPLLEVAPMRYFPMSLNVSNQKLLSLGFKLEYPSFQEGLANTLEWYKQAGWI